MKTLICAFGTDNGIEFTPRHFGDSARFDSFEIDIESVTFLKQILNNSEEEKVHADPKKAGSIANILKQDKVQVVISKHFGPNILRLMKKFVCIKTSSDSIEDEQKIIQENIDLIVSVLLEGDSRGYIVQKKDLSLTYIKK